MGELWGPSSLAGRRGTPLSTLLLRRVVQLIIGDESLRRLFVPAFAFRPATRPMAFLCSCHLLVREALVLRGTPAWEVLTLSGIGEAIVHREGVNIHIIALIGALVEGLLPSADLQRAVPHPIAKVYEQTCGR